MLRKALKYFFSVDTRALILILLGTIIWSLTMVKSGLVYPFGMGFWGPNGHDGIWHIALAESLAKGSWQMPVFAGEAIKNYHIGFDLILAMLHKLTFIPIVNLYFQVLPPILSILLGYFAYRFIYVWKRSHSQAFWATFFVYFGGSFGWVVTLIRNKELGGESLFWAQQSISTLINPPYALSLVFLFAGLYFLHEGLKGGGAKFDKRLILATFLFGLLLQIKVYAGILALGGLLVAGIWRIFQRKGISLIKVFGGAVIISILIFAPVTKSVGQTFIFRPFWFLETMISDPNRFYWPRFAQAMTNYKLAGNWIKGVPAYGLAFLIFWLGNLGIRIIKVPLVFGWLGNIRKLSWTQVFLMSITWAGGLVPVFFIQSGTSWNTIQFMYYSLVFSGILAGVILGQWLEKQKTTLLYSIVVSAIILLTIPTLVATLKHYIPARPPAKISKEELEALNFLSKEPDGVVLTQPFDKKAADDAVDNPPRPLYLYESTAYVSAFSGKPVYLEDQVNLEITSYGWKLRRNEVERFFADPTYDGKYELLEKKGITYVYVIKNLQVQYKGLYLEPNKIFENGEVVVYKYEI